LSQRGRTFTGAKDFLAWTARIRPQCSRARAAMRRIAAGYREKTATIWFAHIGSSVAK
jgi:hypothetical protein